MQIILVCHRPLYSYLFLSALNNLNAIKLCPIIEIDEGQFVLLTHQMSSTPYAALKREVTSLENYRDEILGAIDLLLTGI